MQERTRRRFAIGGYALAAVIALGATIGIAAGVGGYTFVYAKGYSYITNDPAACANCHVMKPQFEAWAKGSHKGVAVCNDCHTPADPIGKYATKARNGFWHSYYFTLGGFEEPIRAGKRSAEIAEDACRRCHAEIVHAIDVGANDGSPQPCVRCHRDVGHAD
jgi:cytochrome c nitrite reductase small subunit